MKHIATILFAAALAIPGVAQDKAQDAPPKASKQSSHAKSLMNIARDLRKKGQVDIAQKIEAQARRLLAADKNRWVKNTTKTK